MYDQDIIKQFEEYVKLNEEVQAEQMQKIAFLEEQLSGLQKTASAQTLPNEQILSTVNNLISVNLLDAQEKQAALDQINQDPSILLQFIDKLAEFEKERRSAVKPLGRVRDDDFRPTETAKQHKRESDQFFDEGIAALTRKL